MAFNKKGTLVINGIDYTNGGGAGSGGGIGNNIFSDEEILWGKVRENGVERNVYHKYLYIPTTGGRHNAMFTIENIDTLIKWDGYINPPSFPTHYGIGDNAYLSQIFSVGTGNVDYYMANNIGAAGIKLFLYYTKVGE